MILILNEQSAWLYPSILTGSLKMDYPFQIACVQPLPPLRKHRRRGFCGRGGRLYTGQSQTDNPFLTLVWKRPTTKCLCPVFLMIAKDCTERLSVVALSAGLIIPRGICVSGDVSEWVFFFSDTPPKYPDRDCVGTRRTGTRHSNVYRSVMQRKTGNCCLPATCFTNSGISACCFTSTSRARPPKKARSQIFAIEKISSPRKRRKRSLGLGQHLKGACPNMRTESKYPGNKKRNHKWV